MAFSAGAPNRRDEGSYEHNVSMTSGRTDWPEPEKEPRDIKKMFLVIGLGALSWAATYVGMLELIQANLGVLPLEHKILIGFSVAMLMTMIIWLLDQIFSPSNYGTKVVFILGYLFLSVISVGFGFGFYWKVLESRSESTRSAESAIGQVQNSLHAGLTRMQQLTLTLQSVEQISKAKAIEERDKGSSCPNSSPGDGPRRKLRDADASSFLFASQFVSRRVDSVKSDMTVLDADMKKVMTGDSSTIDAKSGTRNDFLRDLNRRLDLTVTGFNAFRTDPQLRQIRADLNDRSSKTVFPNGNGGTFICPDQQLQAALRGVVRAIDQLPEMGKPQIAAVEGSEATIEAFRRLTASITGILTLTPPMSPDELRQLQKKAIQSVSNQSGALAAPAYAQPTGLGKRDYVPLAIAIFVDLCLLLVSIGRPMNRLNNLLPKMREAEKGPVIQILSRFNEIHRDPEVRQNFEVFRHVVFDYLGDYYVAVPLDAPYNHGGPGAGAAYSTEQAQELQHEAHLLSNLFASFEQEKIFKRVYFMPTRTVRSRLQRQGSKFAASSAFRLYRFKEGAWSDIILGAVMGAAKRVEAEKEHRRAMAEQQHQSRGPTLDGSPDQEASNGARRNKNQDSNSATFGVNGRGEAGPSGKIPPYVLSHVPGASSRWAKNGNAPPAANSYDASAATDSKAPLNGMAKNGHATAQVLNGNGASSVFAQGSPEAIMVEDYFDDEELDPVTSEDEDQIRSRYGKYAEKILAERTHTTQRKAARDTQQSSKESKAQSVGEENTDLTSSAANSNTMPSSVSQNADQTGDATREVIQLPSMDTPIGSSAKSKQASDGELLAQDEDRDPVILEVSELQDSETTVTLTRETATYTVPAGEAVVPPALKRQQPPPLPEISNAPEQPENDDETVTALAARKQPELKT